ncbi:FAD-dependent oxidoreductase, partial [Escherichia coli]|uniref:FAD-dependent oxidoreductase n=1 Tax=Escherichia coli TaxID=562 RepID=UPI00200F1186
IFKDVIFPRRKLPSLVVAQTLDEHKIIEQLYQRGMTNGLTKDELFIIDKAKIAELEPNMTKNVHSALYCNSSWCIDPVKASNALAVAAHNSG